MTDGGALLDDVTLIGVDCVDIGRLVRAAEISTERLRFADMRLLSSIEVDHPWVRRIEAIEDMEGYNDFVLKQLHEHVATPFALVVQHDGFVLNPDAWTDDFLQWDYIGAPWGVDGERVVGNGGFSLRSRRLLKRLAELDVARPQDCPEDWFICVTIRGELERSGIRFAPPDVAHQFSFEGDSQFGVSWSGEFGFHGLTWTDISAWLAAHPDSGIVNHLDNESLELLEGQRRRAHTQK